MVEDPLAVLLLALEVLPAGLHRAGAVDVRVAEDVRVASDELVVDAARDALELARAAFLEQQRQEVDLEQQVAELVEELGVVARAGRVGDLVRLLDGVRDDRARGLRPVPGTVAPEAPRQLLKVDKGLGEAQLSPSSPLSSWWRWCR